MIPEFPNFKKICLTDRKDIESYTDKFPPYSDFNFINLWSWNPKVQEGRMISKLNNNLVVHFTDYRTKEPSLSFLGTNNCTDTAKKLIEFAKAKGVSETLCYIVQESAEKIHNNTLTVEEDIDNFDYIFSVKQLANTSGANFKSKRHLSNRFCRDYPDTHLKFLNFSDSETHKKIISVLRKWENKKIQDNKSYELDHEEIALQRLLKTAHNHNLILSGFFFEDEMIGFSLDELLPNNYAISHFFKADTNFKGIYEFMNKMMAEYLLSRKVELWNWEQDLNIDGLRRLKMSYRPVGFLKKYKVSTVVKQGEVIIQTDT